MKIPQNRLMRQSDAARMLGIKKQAITSYIKRGNLTAHIVAGVTFVDRAEIEARLERRK